jgi:salicylate hydroxylase
MTCWEVLNGTTLEAIERTRLHDSQERYGAKIHTIHRADLHIELTRLALAKIDGLKDAELQLGSPVIAADAEEGFVELEDGTRHRADLIVAADGIHSVMKDTVLKKFKAGAQAFSGMNAFRFQIPTALLENNDHFIDMLKVKGKGSTVLVDTKELKSERHLVWYDCQG